MIIIYILTEMNKTKSTAQSGHSTTRPILISANTKFEKLDQLNTLVHEISYKEQSKLQQKEERFITNTREIKVGTSDKVLQLLKNRIKTNYDQLYNNYGDNKQKIIKQIQAVQTNIAGQNSMNNKFDDIIKEKAKYDKLKADVENKQKKLKKYNDLKQQLLNQNMAKNQSEQSQVNLTQKIGILEEKKMEIQHQSAILKQMLKNRKKIHLNLSQKYNRLFEENTKKTDRKNKLSIQNLKKQKIIKNLQQKLLKEDEIQIPSRLAEQLSEKIQMYENKHSYNNIIEHEAILQEERYKKLKEDIQNERQMQKLKNKRRDIQEKNQLEQLYNIYLIKNMELEKIKRLCAADSIETILTSDGSLDSKNLQQIKKEIQTKIEQEQNLKKAIQKNIQNEINHEDLLDSTNVQELQLIVEQQKKKLMLLQAQGTKKQLLCNEWLTILDLLKVKPENEDLQSLLLSLESQYVKSQGNVKKTHQKKTKLLNQLIDQHENEQSP